MATKSEKNFWILLVFILCGLVIGGLLGNIAGNVNWLWWLSFGDTFGFENPFILDLSILKITFALTIKINIASIIGIAIAIFIYRKIWKNNIKIFKKEYYKKLNVKKYFTLQKHNSRGRKEVNLTIKEFPETERPYEKLELMRRKKFK